MPCAFQSTGWLCIPHVDGQWVTAAKLEPFSLAILKHWRAALPVQTQTGSKPIPGADLQFFTELRAIIADHSQPLGNRLQSLDARIALLSGAPQIGPGSPERQALQMTERRTPQALIADDVKKLTQLADAMGVVFTVDRKPLQPLAMGHAEYAVSVWNKREAT